LAWVFTFLALWILLPFARNTAAWNALKIRVSTVQFRPPAPRSAHI
jgi:hypothetical protein